MLIALDWNGTLIEHPSNVPLEEVLKYEAMPNAVRVVNYLRSKGYELYVCTAHENQELKHIRKWLKERGFPKMVVTNKKLAGTKVYIDDRAIRFTNWLDIGKYFT